MRIQPLIWRLFSFLNRRMTQKKSERAISDRSDRHKIPGHTNIAGSSQTPVKKQRNDAEFDIDALIDEMFITAPLDEPVSVLLRRQVPPKTEKARSWLGGLPSMPEDIAWPRGKKPLHFLAQIDCADLPDQLWNGLGPRRGWLLFFGCLDEMLDGYRSSACRVVHSTELGSEREPPGDLGPVDDSRSRWGHLPGDSSIPNIWRRWPVDLLPVAVPPDAQPPLFDVTKELYDGAPVAPPSTWPEPIRSLTVGHVLIALEYLADQLPLIDPQAGDIKRQPELLSEIFASRFSSPEGYKHLLETLHAEVHHFREQSQDAEAVAAALRNADGSYRLFNGPRPSENPLLEKSKWLQTQIQQIEKLGDGSAVVDWLAGEAATKQAFRTRLHRRIAAIARQLRQRDPDDSIDQDAWETTQEAVEDEVSWVKPCWSHLPSPTKEPSIFKRTERASLRSPPFMRELAVDLYLDASKRPALDQVTIQAYEPWMRRHDFGRPHRMGGYHDGVQTSWSERGKDDVLLLQLASDGLLRWTWGDVGALYFWIDRTALKKGDWSTVRVICEAN